MTKLERIIKKLDLPTPTAADKKAIREAIAEATNVPVDSVSLNLMDDAALSYELLTHFGQPERAAQFGG